VRLKIRVLHLPKAGSADAEYEDSSASSCKKRIAAVSDGASNNFESRLWARLLTQAFVERPPEEWGRPQVLDWVDSVAAEWSGSIPWKDLTVFEEAKAASGSAATLIGLRLESSSRLADEGTWRCLAWGDSCLFQVTQGRLVTKLPVAKSADFDIHPPLLSTRREISRLTIDQLITDSGEWHAGDTFYLLTDAIAAWFLLDTEQGGSPWEILSSFNKRSFASFVKRARAQKLMRNDDVTVVTLNVLARHVGRHRRPLGASTDSPRRFSSHRESPGPARRIGRTAGGESRCP
jgi:hypothetical protein